MLHDSLNRKAEEHIPEGLQPALLPILDTIGELTRQIKEMERWIMEFVGAV